MARSCGIRIGPRRYEIVVLDGTAKKHRIKAFKSAEFDSAALDPVEEAVDALREAVKELNVPKDNVGLVIDSGHAAFRHLTLPFDDPAKIDQVLKFEVESKLPQWNIDDVVADYHIIEKRGSDSELLVTAVPKDDVRATLDVLEEAGVEALEAELETTAMVNAAFAADLSGPESAQLLVHVGDVSTSVVLVDGAHVREMRVIHIGALTHDASAAAAGTVDPDGEGEDVPVASPSADPIEVARRNEQATKRIRRELGRTLSAARTQFPIDAIYVCGMELPGLVGSTVLDVPVYILDCFEEDGGQPVDGFGELVVAYGAAYRQLGGGLLSPSLRREELRYAGTWERIEFPLAVTSLLLVTLLGVVFILQTRKLEFQDRYGYGYWLYGSNLYMAGNGGTGRLYPVPEDIEQLVSVGPTATELETDEPAMSLLQRTSRLLRTSVTELEKDLGQDAEIKQPQSAFVGMQLVLSVLEPNAERWRPSIRRIQAITEAEKAGQRPEQVQILMNLVFFADEYQMAVENLEAFQRELADQPWFISSPQIGTQPLENIGGCEVNGMRVAVDANWYYEQLKRNVLEQSE